MRVRVRVALCVPDVEVTGVLVLVHRRHHSRAGDQPGTPNG
jgi:hypothetical protein